MGLGGDGIVRGVMVAELLLLSGLMDGGVEEN
jgi:hypothetical protein